VFFFFHQTLQHDRCNGCTARPRIMTAREQNDSGCDLIGWLFRAVQMAEYEASYASSVAAFALAGLLPVLPGPCTLLRYSALVESSANKDKNHNSINENVPLMNKHSIRESPFEHFERVLETPAHETGVVLENVKLAEVRKQSFCLLFVFVQCVNL
jgi:cellulose synthase/poly-beta-1,6-N-acetylglucosamine synthase-like glycosyltransferase